MYVLDTNVVSELRKVRTRKVDANVAVWAESTDAADLFVSSTTIMELEMGILSVERKDAVHGAVLRSWLERHATLCLMTDAVSVMRLSPQRRLYMGWR